MNIKTQVTVIRAYITRGDDAGRAYFIEAGHKLIELRKHVNAKLFRVICEKKIGRGLRQCQRYMAWALDAAKLEAKRAKDRAYVAKKTGDRHRSHAQPPSPVKPSSPDNAQSVVATHDGHKAAVVLTMIRQGDFISREVFAELPHLPKSIDLTELADAAKQAAEGWKIVAASLRKRKHAPVK